MREDIGSPVATKLLVLSHYPKEDVLADEVLLAKLREQLDSCEKRMSGVLEKYEAIRSVVTLCEVPSVRIAAALEWKEVKQEKERLSGKAAKLHKEISELGNRVARRKVLRDWAAK